MTCQETAINVKEAAGGWYGEGSVSRALHIASAAGAIECDRGDHDDKRHHGIDPLTGKEFEWTTP